MSLAYFVVFRDLFISRAGGAGGAGGLSCECTYTPLHAHADINRVRDTRYLPYLCFLSIPFPIPNEIRKRALESPNGSKI